MTAAPGRTPAPALTPEEVRRALGPIVAREGGGPAGWAERLSAFLGLLQRRNAAVNLVSRRTAGEALARHVLPSLAALRLVKPGVSLRLLDIGSGGGFPGIPIRILRPDVRLDLVEATRNKCRFLRECIDFLEWKDAAVHWCRIETPTEELIRRAPFDLAVARAVGQEELLGRAVEPLLREGREAWAFARPGEGEIEWVGQAGEPLTSLRRLGAGTAADPRPG